MYADVWVYLQQIVAVAVRCRCRCGRRLSAIVTLAATHLRAHYAVLWCVRARVTDAAFPARSARTPPRWKIFLG